MARKRVTLSQVAQEAGVAASTASLVLAGRADELRISTAAQERVRDAARRLGYRPNALSTGLRTGTTRTLGFVSDSVASSQLAGEMIRGSIEAARARGYMVFVGETGGDAHLERDLLDAMFDRQVDGVVLATMMTHARAIPTEATRMPTVLLNIEPTDYEAYVRVLPDEFEAGAAAARLLVDTGHRRIHLIGVGVDPAHAHPFGLAAAQRLRGVLSVLEDAGLEVASARRAVQWLPPEGFRLVTDLLDSGAEVDAILCLNDRLAMGAYQALQERGVTVPDEVSVLSFDDTSFARWLRPGLTTFAFPQRALGRAATDELIDLIERGAAAPPPGPARLIASPLRLRESVADRGSLSGGTGGGKR